MARRAGYSPTTAKAVALRRAAEAAAAEEGKRRAAAAAARQARLEEEMGRAEPEGATESGGEEEQRAEKRPREEDGTGGRPGRTAPAEDAEQEWLLEEEARGRGGEGVPWTADDEEMERAMATAAHQDEETDAGRPQGGMRDAEGAATYESSCADDGARGKEVGKGMGCEAGAGQDASPWSAPALGQQLEEGAGARRGSKRPASPPAQSTRNARSGRGAGLSKEEGKKHVQQLERTQAPQGRASQGTGSSGRNVRRCQGVGRANVEAARARGTAKRAREELQQAPTTTTSRELRAEEMEDLGRPSVRRRVETDREGTGYGRGDPAAQGGASTH